MPVKAYGFDITRRGSGYRAEAGIKVGGKKVPLIVMNSKPSRRKR